jgi:ABC-2 type transport system permease protein
VFLPDSYKAVEQGGTWNLTGVLIVTAIWLVVGLVLCRVTFRWIRKDR